MTTCSGRNASGFETQHSLMLLKADLEARKDTVSAKQVKCYPQSLGKPNLGQEPLRAKLEFQVMQIHRDQTPIPNLESDARRKSGSDSNKATITNNNHLPPAPCPVDAAAADLIDVQESKDDPRSDTDPEFMGKE